MKLKELAKTAMPNETIQINRGSCENGTALASKRAWDWIDDPWKDRDVARLVATDQGLIVTLIDTKEALADFIGEKFNEIFLFYQEQEHITDGGLMPLEALRLDELENEVADFVIASMAYNKRESKEV